MSDPLIQGEYDRVIPSHPVDVREHLVPDEKRLVHSSLRRTGPFSLPARIRNQEGILGRPGGVKGWQGLTSPCKTPSANNLL